MGLLKICDGPKLFHIELFPRKISGSAPACTYCEALCQMDISSPGLCYWETEWMCCDCGEPAVDCIKAGGQVNFQFMNDYYSEYEEKVNPWDYGVMSDPHSLFDLASQLVQSPCKHSLSTQSRAKVGPGSKFECWPPPSLQYF